MTVTEMPQGRLHQSDMPGEGAVLVGIVTRNRAAVLPKRSLGLLEARNYLMCSSGADFYLSLDDEA